jgi:predicted metalloprotease
MELNENAQIDTGQVQDRRGAGGGGIGGGGLGGIPIPIPLGRGRGGLVMTIIIVVATLLLGGIFGGNALSGGGDGDNTQLEQKCGTANPNRLDEADCRNALYINSIQAYWRQALPQDFGKQYQMAQTVFFSRGTNTGCGQADSGVGPFYCPVDHLVYIDLNFYDELANRFGARGAFAQPYVLAHEYGHHVQSLLGTEAQMRRAQQRDPGNANRYSVMLELQADCYAGAWAKHATETTDAGGQPLFTSITAADIKEGQDAAAAVGDDAIQQKAGMDVDESKFTHGTSEQRQRWFRQGFDSGDPRTCDTFGNAV